MKQTTLARPATAVNNWVHLDATDAIVGRLAVRVVRLLMGKDKPIYTPHVDTGDFVVITNVAKMRISGRKPENKVYRHHTGYPGGLVERRYAEVMATQPEEVLQLAVRRMLPKSKLGRTMYGKLKIYRGADHPHAAQQPVTVTL